MTDDVAHGQRVDLGLREELDESALPMIERKHLLSQNCEFVGLAEHTHDTFLSPARPRNNALFSDECQATPRDHTTRQRDTHRVRSHAHFAILVSDVDKAFER